VRFEWSVLQDYVTGRKQRPKKEGLFGGLIGGGGERGEGGGGGGSGEEAKKVK
jgi:hypothetical protein